MSETTETTTTPRVRFGAIAWGLIVCTIAAGVLFAIVDPARRWEVTEWLGTLTPGDAGLILLLALGGLILLLGLLAVIRGAQRDHTLE